MSRDHGRTSGAYCLFTSRSRPMAVSLDVVAEVAEPLEIVRLPLCPPPVLGLCTDRGGVVPVVAPGSDGSGAGDGPGDGGRRPTVLILHSRRGPWGLWIDRLGVSVEDLADVRDDGGPPPPDGFIADGAIVHGGTTHPILDPERTWRALRSVIDGWYGDILGDVGRAGSTPTGTPEDDPGIGEQRG